ncbi:MAG: hypothetical protein ABSA11_02990 [Candidatus Bathyarchaeia archaeon]
MKEIRVFDSEGPKSDRRPIDQVAFELVRVVIIVAGLWRVNIKCDAPLLF